MLTSPKPIKVSVVEDNDKLRESLAALLDGGGFSCASTHASAEEALRQIPLKKPDIVLMDINLVEMSGVECVQKLKEKMPEIKIVMHTIYENREQIFKSLRAGADGYLLKGTPPAKLLESLVEVCHGDSPMSGPIARMVVQHFHQRGAVEQTEHLSPRETEILEHLAKGFRYKEIADTLGIGLATVRTHLRRIYEKLHVSSRTEAVVKFLGK